MSLSDDSPPSYWENGEILLKVQTARAKRYYANANADAILSRPAWQELGSDANMIGVSPQSLTAGRFR
jgi:hypothetical protein